MTGIEPATAPYEGAVLPLAPHQHSFHLRRGIEPRPPDFQSGVQTTYTSLEDYLLERMMGFELTTSCVASRRPSH